MAAACVEAIATGEPVEFAYNDYSGHLGERHRAQFLAEILSNPEVFADCHERRDKLLPVLAEQVVEFLEEEGQRLD